MINSIVLCCLSLCVDNKTPEHNSFDWYVAKNDSRYSDPELSQALLTDHNHYNSSSIRTFCSVNAIQAWKNDVCDKAQGDILEQDAIRQGVSVPRIE
ncbi:hypothetical protein KBD08_02670 [Candidatus Babeliales bacterium]|nr:hypothetical protein [Candidatus Babeliales bacterium]